MVENVLLLVEKMIIVLIETLCRVEETKMTGTYSVHRSFISLLRNKNKNMT